MMFSEIAIGASFYCNGNVCVKKSTRTALIVKYGRTFYYAQNETVEAINA